MAPEKCSYLISSLAYKTGENGKKGVKREELNLKLYASLHNNPTFLGMRFDKFMCCINQVKYVKEKCNERLNIIKVLSHPSWKIDKNTLLQLYKSLVRSLIEGCHYFSTALFLQPVEK